MSIQFDKKHFAKSRPLPMLVVVDPCKRHLKKRGSLAHGDTAGGLARCRAALAHARELGMVVAFVRDRRTREAASESAWINNFEPGRYDRLFELRAPSCYSSPYFAEAAAASGEIVVIGYLADGACVSTALDAVRAGHNIVFLRDAVIAGPTERAFCRAIADVAALSSGSPIGALDTTDWTMLPKGSQSRVPSAISVPHRAAARIPSLRLS